MPGIRAVSSYRREWLVKDLVAGVVLTMLLVPQGMAYAELAGLPPITGLYTTMLCLLGYAVCGPSRILVLGPDSSLGPMTAATVLPLVAADGDPDRAVALASVLALMAAQAARLQGRGGQPDRRVRRPRARTRRRGEVMGSAASSTPGACIWCSPSSRTRCGANWSGTD